MALGYSLVIGGGTKPFQAAPGGAVTVLDTEHAVM
jgi:hypothetical protein